MARLDELDLRRPEAIGPPDVGYEIGLNFETPPSLTSAWGEMKAEIFRKFGTASLALIDNTTALNAMLLMQHGVGAPLSDRYELNYGAFLPDLTTLVFGLTHFDHLLVMDHTNAGAAQEQRVRTLIEWCQGAIQPLMIPATNTAGQIAHDLGEKFYRIESKFFERRDLHLKWRQSWTALMGGDVAEPFPFTGEFGVQNKKYQRLQSDFESTIFRTPKHPLQADDDYGALVVPAMIESNQRYGAHADFTAAECQAVYASYHTFRTVFYHGLADFLRVPYLPCGVRQVATNVFPVFEDLRAEQMDSGEFLRQVDSYTTEKSLRLKLPVLQINPSLAAFFKRALEIKGASRLSGTHWQQAIGMIRLDSESYRTVTARLLRACQAGNLAEIESVTSNLGIGTSEAAEVAASIMGIVIELVNGNYAGVLKEMLGAFAKKPWQAISHFPTRLNASFIVRARQLASQALSLEGQCEKLWGNGFSARERRYLTRLGELA